MSGHILTTMAKAWGDQRDLSTIQQAAGIFEKETVQRQASASPFSAGFMVYVYIYI